VIVGDGYGILNAFKDSATQAPNGEALVANFGDAVKKTAFAYEGWVCATAINAELKDSKKNLPRALVGGTVAILIFYLVYYISLSAF
jgi:APA family basic amino acid/polyamine antiporter